MKAAVRYYSRSGNTKAVAEAIAEAAGVKAISVDAIEAPLTEPVDVLFVGGALYAYGLDANLKDYLRTLSKDKVGKGVVFSTSWISKHSIDLIKKGLAAKGIPYHEEAFYVRSRPGEAQLDAAKKFAEKALQ